MTENDESYYITDKDGNILKKTKSNLEDSYLIIETGKNLDELNNSQIIEIKKQDDLYKYDKLKTYTKSFSSYYNIVYGFGKLIIPFL